MVDFGPPGAEKLIFSDKTSSSLIHCSPKRTHFTFSHCSRVSYNANDADDADDADEADETDDADEANEEGAPGRQ